MKFKKSLQDRQRKERTFIKTSEDITKLGSYLSQCLENTKDKKYMVAKKRYIQMADQLIKELDDLKKMVNLQEKESEHIKKYEELEKFGREEKEKAQA